jgi:hypothetical protein
MYGVTEKVQSRAGGAVWVCPVVGVPARAATASAMPSRPDMADRTEVLMLAIC